jgi:hypothetical protein
VTDHKPLPVSGYTTQTQTNIELANEGKVLEELYLRWLDKLDALPDTDKRCIALGRTNVQQGAMWAVRAIFKPTRVKLEGDSNV